MNLFTKIYSQIQKKSNKLLYLADLWLWAKGLKHPMARKIGCTLFIFALLVLSIGLLSLWITSSILWVGVGITLTGVNFLLHAKSVGEVFQSARRLQLVSVKAESIANCEEIIKVEKKEVEKEIVGVELYPTQTTTGVPLHETEPENTFVIKETGEGWYPQASEKMRKIPPAKPVYSVAIVYMYVRLFATGLILVLCFYLFPASFLALIAGLVGGIGLIIYASVTKTGPPGLEQVRN